MISRDLNILDLITILSFYIAVENLDENEQQTNMLKNKLDEQDDKYLKKAIDLIETSIKQNKIIIEQNEKLLERI